MGSGVSTNILAEELEVEPKVQVMIMRWLLRCAHHPDGCEEWYYGSILDGERHDKGAAFYPNGSVYYGLWKNGQWHGVGAIRSLHSAQYDGEFYEGQRHGRGEETSMDGVKYIGTWREDRKSGYGTMTTRHGGSYEGEFENGCPHGKGKIEWADGTAYEGGFERGREHGDGVLFNAEGRKFAEIYCNHGELCRQTEYLSDYDSGDEWNDAYSLCVKTKGRGPGVSPRRESMPKSPSGSDASEGEGKRWG